MIQIKQALQDLVQLEGIHTVVVVGRDGFVIEGAAKSGHLDSERVGAQISTAFHAFEVIGRELKVGDLSQTTTEYADGMIMMSGMSQDAILAAMTDLSANLGYVRYHIKKSAQMIDLLL